MEMQNSSETGLFYEYELEVEDASESKGAEPIEKMMSVSCSYLEVNAYKSSAKAIYGPSSIATPNSPIASITLSPETRQAYQDNKCDGYRVIAKFPCSGARSYNLQVAGQVSESTSLPTNITVFSATCYPNLNYDKPHIKITFRDIQGVSKVVTANLFLM